jgi:hypothetical protein
MVKLAAIQTKVVPSRQSSTSDDSDDDEPIKKGGNILFSIDKLKTKYSILVSTQVLKKAAVPAPKVSLINGNKKKKDSSSSSDSSDEDVKKPKVNSKTAQPVKVDLKRKAAASSSSSSDSDDVAPPANKKQPPSTPTKSEFFSSCFHYFTHFICS